MNVTTGKMSLCKKVLPALLIALSANAAYANEHYTINGKSVIFDVGSADQSFQLRVSGPNGYFYSHTFNADEELALNLDDSATDGSYTFEIQGLPNVDPSLRKILNDARDLGMEQDISRAGLLPNRTDVISGYFTVVKGEVLSLTQDEELALLKSSSSKAANDKGGTAPTTELPIGGLPVVDRDVATRDQIILDDLIVDGSACIGFDCVNGEAFGFDTLRLKENNLRIKAQDTSNSASFPSNDWQITFNDSSNGGANKYSIDDIDGGRTPFTIEAGAPSHSLYVDDAGRIGLGTSTPVVQLHVKDGNTPTLRLEQDGSSGFTPQTWDVAGNEANFFIRDATNGSKLPFRIFPGAPTDSLRVSNQGDLNVVGDLGLGIGSATPTSSIQIEKDGANISINDTTGSNGARELLTLANQGSVTVSMTNSAASTTWKLQNGGTDFKYIKDGTSVISMSSKGIKVEAGGYAQLDSGSAAPPSTDCDNAGERGRMFVDSTAESLYVCVDSGWKIF